MPQVRVKIEGLNRILGKLDPANPVYAQPWNNAVKRGTVLLEERVEDRAPFEKGQLISNVTHRLETRPGRFSFGIVTVNAENKGFRFPFALEAGKGKKYKTGNFLSGIITRGKKGAFGSWSVTHYRTSSMKGKKTRGWFSGARRGFAKVLQPILDAAARELEARWGR